MEHIVTGCKDCPFRGEVTTDIYDEDDELEGERTTYYCRHPKRYLIDLYESDDGVVTPSDCPLLKESTTIKLIDN
jgi:hypothetical protein